MTSTGALDAERPLTSDPPTVRRAIVGLDGVRALAAGLVMLFHFRHFAGYTLPGGLDLVAGTGWVGVDIFFAISGFILFLPWARSHFDGAVVSRRRYFRNRALRILPAYWFNLMVLVTLSASAQLFTFVGLRHLVANFTFTAGYAEPGTWTLINGVTWTLFCEVAFYVLLPVLARMFVGRRWLVALPVVVGLCMLFRWWAISSYAGGSDSQPVVEQSLMNIGSTLDEFAFGMAMASVWARLEFSQTRLPRWAPLALLAAGAALIWGTLWVLQDVLGGTAYWLGTGSWGWAPLLTFKSIIAAGAALLIFGVCYQHTPVRRMFSSRVIAYLGTISYGLYLWHLPIAERLVPGMPPSWSPGERFLALLTIGTLITCAWAALSFRFIESPFLAAKRPAVSTGDQPVARANEGATRIG